MLALLVTLASAHGDAQAARPRRVELTWHDDGSCAAPIDAEQQLATLLGPAHGVAEPKRAHARVERTDATYRLTLEAEQVGGAGSRTLELGSCAEVQETVVLLLAMTLEPRAAQPEPVAPEPEPTQERRTARPTRFGLGAHLGADFTLLPGTAAIGALGFAVQRSALRLGVQGRYLARSTSERLPGASEARISVLELSPTACVMVPLASLSLGLCADAALGRVRGRAQGVDMPRTQRAFWASAGGSALLEYAPSAALSLQAGLSVGASMRRPRFALVGDAPFHELPPLLVRAQLGFTVWLPTTEARLAGH